MKKIYTGFAICGALCATGAIGATMLPKFSMSDLNLEKISGANATVSPQTFKGGPVTNLLPQNSPALAASSDELPACVQVETLVSEDFHLWIKGTNEIPDSERIEDSEEFLSTMMSYPGDWILFDVYQAGQAAYLGFDEVGDNGPGYISTPTFDASGNNIAYRLRITAMNVNENSQNQGLQNFFLDEVTSNFLSASALPIPYKEWGTVEWIGQSDCKEMRAMFFGWQGKVLIDEVVVDKLIYPLATPKISSMAMEDVNAVKVTWNEVEGATSYKVNITLDNEIIGTTTVTNETEAIVETPALTDATYVAEVIAYNGDDCSYPARKGGSLAPTSVGTAVANEATEVSENGFTANWERAKNASQYMIFPTVNHTSDENGELFMLLEDSFQNVPEEEGSQAIISPLLGMGDMNRYMACAGWSTDICAFLSLAPGMSGLVLMNTYAEMGLPGFILSPLYDLSVGGGNVTVSGMGMSAADDVVVTASLIDASTGEEYSSADIELSIMGDMFEVVIPDGRANSYIKLVMTDYADEDMVIFFALNISVDLNEGESINAPLPTVFVDGMETSYEFDYPVDEYNSYTYSVQGFFGDIIGGLSNVIEVSNGVSGVASTNLNNASVRVDGNTVLVSNPDGNLVSAYTVDGRRILSSYDRSLNINDFKGVLLVKVGDRIFKVMK